jgi:curved DNA-binding protein CbpA
MASGRDYYSILGVDRMAGEAEIKQAYRKLALKFHPDRNPGESRDGLASSSFQEVNEAYHNLIDKEKRAKYNKAMTEKAAGVEGASVQSNQAEMSYRYGLEAYKANQFKRAVEYFRVACKLNPKKAIYHNRLGLAIIKAAGPLEDARASCEKAVQIEMYNPEHYLTMGIIYQTAGMNDKAREQFKEALKWDPKNVQAQKRLEMVGKGDKGFLGKLFGGK